MLGKARTLFAFSERSTGILFAAIAALAVGLLVPYLGNAIGAGVWVAPLTLLPVVSHIRWVGFRKALSEPSVATVVVLFYVFIFPLRGMVLALGDLTDFNLPAGLIDMDELVSVLALVSCGTTAFVEAYHCARKRTKSRERVLETNRDVVGALAALLGLSSLGALTEIYYAQGGLGGAQAAFIGHGKDDFASARSPGLSVWATVSVPTVWCAAIVAADHLRTARARSACVGLGAVVVTCQLVVFGSRLSALLALLGVWAVLYYSGRSISPTTVVTALIVAVLISVPVLTQRAGGNAVGVSAVDIVSEITGYGILDAALAVHQAPEAIQAQLEDPQRWWDLPFYLVPRAVWPERPELLDRRLDVYVAQTFGTRAQQNSGYPQTFMLELWLYGGLPLLVGAALLAGAASGAAHKKLLEAPGHRYPGLILLAYCFVLNYAFTYYKDGDIVTTLVGLTRNAVYLSVLVGTVYLAHRLVGNARAMPPETPVVRRATP